MRVGVKAMRPLVTIPTPMSMILNAPKGLWRIMCTPISPSSKDRPNSSTQRMKTLEKSGALESSNALSRTAMRFSVYMISVTGISFGQRTVQ